jgi:hypothetical protein
MSSSDSPSTVDQLQADLDVLAALGNELKARLVPSLFADDDLLRLTTAVSSVSRVLESAQVVLAAEIDDRSRPERGSDRLCALTLMP